MSNVPSCVNAYSNERVILLVFAQGTAASELLEQLDFLLHVYREKKDFSKFVFD